jgi:hypothetical protein
MDRIDHRSGEPHVWDLHVESQSPSVAYYENQPDLNVK